MEVATDLPRRKRQQAFQEKVLRHLDHIEGRTTQLMADVTALTAAIDKLDTDEQAAVVELHALAAKIAELQAGEAPTQAQIDELTAHATAVASALETGTAAP